MPTNAIQSNYPILIPTKGRYENPLTIRALDKIGVAYRIVVEGQELDKYSKVVKPERIIILPHRDKGLVVTRNWIWDFARDEGYKRFWTIDDNIKAFYRFNRNLKVPVSDGAIFLAMEDFVERYQNVLIAGMNYFMFASRKTGNIPPFTPNTRVYSNMLILTNARDRKGRPFRNEGFYNDDTDLCLRVLKEGFCTILFNAFLAEKAVTMTVDGGMTPFYKGDGRFKMAEELRRKHPDVVKTSVKWNRWQHHVDYRPFKKNKLIRKAGIEIPNKPNEYGMKLVEVK